MLTLRIVIITLGTVVLGALVLLLVFVYSGSYNIAATAPHTAFGQWLLETTKNRSIRAHAKELQTDIPAVGGEQLQHGIDHYIKMCVPCHGAPGVERGEYGKGMTPTPPDLAKAAEEWSAPELYWILKHGIKLAGMPAFGATHTDYELWGIVSFVQQLPNISPAEFNRLAAEQPVSSPPASPPAAPPPPPGEPALDPERSSEHHSAPVG